MERVDAEEVAAGLRHDLGEAAEVLEVADPPVPFGAEPVELARDAEAPPLPKPVRHVAVDALGHGQRAEADRLMRGKARGDLGVAVGGDAHGAEQAAHGIVRNADGLAGERRVFAHDARRGGESVKIAVHGQGSSPEKSRSVRPSRSTVAPPGSASPAGRSARARCRPGAASAACLPREA